MNTKDLFTEIKPADECYILTFGKYKGLPVGVIIERDPSYLLWLEENVLTFVLTGDLWELVSTRIVQSLLSNRKKKIETIVEINNKINSMSDEQKNKKRKRFYAEKTEKKEE